MYQIDDLFTYTSSGNEKPEFIRLQMDYLYTFKNQGQIEIGIQLFSRWNKTRYNLRNTKENSNNCLSNLSPNKVSLTTVFKSSVSDVFDTSEWQARSNTGSYCLTNYSKEATHAYWIGLTFNFNNFKSRASANDSHPQKRQVIQLGQ